MFFYISSYHHCVYVRIYIIYISFLKKYRINQQVGFEHSHLHLHHVLYYLIIGELKCGLSSFATYKCKGVQRSTLQGCVLQEMYKLH